MKLFTSLALSSSGVFSVHLAFSVVYQITCIVHIILYIVYDFWNRIFPLDFMIRDSIDFEFYFFDA